jgi:hypothetical protein
MLAALQDLQQVYRDVLDRVICAADAVFSQVYTSCCHQLSTA